MTDSLPNNTDLLKEAEAALDAGQFIAYYQPQYDHSMGLLVGAEALARWNHPEKGVLAPAVFIPLFEQSGAVTKLDLVIFERACAFLRKCLDSGRRAVPISVNISRRDLSVPGFTDRLEEIRSKYQIPAKLLPLELTESAVADGGDTVSAFINSVHELGYIVEMDDFGSGYSSLNVLKDIDFDRIKLDLQFFSEAANRGKAGTIVTAVVRMCLWLGLPMIAEGVETLQQADFMKSIGCDYVQGYLYAKPQDEAAFLKRLDNGGIAEILPKLDLIETLKAGTFWDPKSQETLIFNNYVGAAAIFEQKSDRTELLRVNEKYLQELGMNMNEKDLVSKDPSTMFSEDDRKIYRQMLDRARETGEEQECETWRTLKSRCCGEEHICIRSTVRMIGKSPVSTLFYANIRNITAEKNRFNKLEDTERRFMAASEQANIYFWEYTVATKEMRPCFRCMRDLGLPPLVQNYPEPAIKMGIFPPEVADMYRDWHKQIAAGVPSLEAIMPLTVGRVPFHVRYTTEFDETGRPVKAYGSATLVVDKKE